MMRSISEVAVCCFIASTRRSCAWAISRLYSLSCCSRSARVWRVRPTRAFVPVKRSLRPRGRPFAPARDKVTSILGLGPNAGRHSRGLALSENSTQPRARVSMLTALDPSSK